VNKSKTKIEKSYNRQTVNGILVNHSDPRVPRRYLNEVRRKFFELREKITDPEKLTYMYCHLKGVCEYLLSINPEIKNI
jgi:hypothetical protein